MKQKLLQLFRILIGREIIVSKKFRQRAREKQSGKLIVFTGKIGENTYSDAVIIDK